MLSRGSATEELRLRTAAGTALWLRAAARRRQGLQAPPVSLTAIRIALVALVEHLRARKFVLLDTQWLTPHLQQFGGIQISRAHYLRLLRRAIDLPRSFE